METKDRQAQEMVDKARVAFGHDLLTPGYSGIISDNEHLAGILKLCDLLPGRRYLDIGTGTGYVAFELAAQNPSVSVTGIDIVEQVVAADNQKAHETGSCNLEFVTFGGMTFPFDAGAFHGTVCRYAFHHFPLPELTACEIRRVLEPGGFCVISDPMALAEDRADFVNRFGALKDDGHRRYYPQAELVSLFEKAGFFVELCFASKITFSRRLDDRYAELLEQSDLRILESYAVHVEGEEIWITLPVMNIRFRRSSG